MKLHISGFESAINMSDGAVTVIEVHNKTLFSRIYQSLLSGQAENAVEPYSVWDDFGKEVSSVATFKFIADPLNLPWSDKDLGGKTHDCLEVLFFEDESLRREVEELHRSLQARIMTLELQMQSSYSFALEWEMKKFLKAFCFSVDVDIEEPLLDNMIRFFELLVDVEYKKTLFFVNLKSFFSENELAILYEQAVFFEKRIVLLESAIDEKKYKYEKKYLIDQDLILN